MESSCWYRQNLEQFLLKRKKSLSISVSGSSGNPRASPAASMEPSLQSLRKRSKSTSSDGVDYTQDFKNSVIRCGCNQCSTSSSVLKQKSSSNNPNDPSFINVYNNDRVFNRFGNLLAGSGEFLTCRKSPASNSKTRGGGASFVDIMNAILLTSVFLAGAFSAIFLTICYMNNGEFGGGQRKGMFQPFPQVAQLQVIDESFLNKDIPNLLEEYEEDNECDGENKLGLELEAISSLHVATDMKEQGKLAKAQKLFKHAMALCPRHPDVLTNYGEFFEDTRQDYLMADHLYVQALAYAPRHTKALIGRKRTLPVVEELDERRMKRIDSKREQLQQLPESNRALNRIRKEAYFQHIYHSAGIEGNTMTLSQTRLIVETRTAIGGKSIIEHNEILGLDAALKFINSTLVNRVGKITLQDILLVHKHLMGFVEPDEAGKVRRTQVFVGSHVPPPPEELSEQMNQLVEWLNSEEALSLHPIHYAAIAHYKFVYIHPFLDGNGRTSRLLMNWVLMQANYPPVIIRKQDRYLYYEHLNTANKGDIRPFIRFIGDCTEKTMDVYLWATQEHYPILELENEAGRDY